MAHQHQHKPAPKAPEQMTTNELKARLNDLQGKMASHVKQDAQKAASAQRKYNGELKSYMHDREADMREAARIDCMFDDDHYYERHQKVVALRNASQARNDDLAQDRAELRRSSKLEKKGDRASLIDAVKSLKRELSDG